MLPIKERNDEKQKAEMNVERKIIQNKTCVQNKRKHREKKEIRTKNKQKKSSSDFLYFNFSSFIKKKNKRL